MTDYEMQRLRDSIVSDLSLIINERLTILEHALLREIHKVGRRDGGGGPL